MVPDQHTRELRRDLLSFIQRRISNPADAEDIVQRVLTKLHQGGPRSNEKKQILAWVYRTTRNEVVDYYRAQKPATDIATLEAGLAQDPDEPTGAELARCLLHVLDKLPPHYREAVVLSEIDGLGQKEIAAQTGTSLSGAKSRVQRGRRQLQALILACCHLEVDAYGNPVEQHCTNPDCACCG